MTTVEPATASDVRLMQALAQRITALRPELVNSDASYGELAWNWGRDDGTRAVNSRRLWWAAGELVAWAWIRLPHPAAHDNRAAPATAASLVHQVHPAHRKLVDDVIDWYETTASHLDRTALPGAADTFALTRWTAHGYTPDPAGLGVHGTWTRLNTRDLTHLRPPVLPPGFRFRTADEAGPDAAVRAHRDAWSPSTYSAEKYEGVRRTTAYRGDLHVLVEAPDGTMACSAIMWLDQANRTVQFEPVGTHPDHRRRGLARALLLHGMSRARAVGATHATVACLGAPGHRAPSALYESVGFRELSRDLPLLKRARTD
ncbi:GNAT family N-acetyltransferase (plasmid) [Streptomyces sp. BI20]|uniref:GNAT family N-acetyltransferase n=1 Tax=Streptomyces sp. BI20 TaxID=3403460 RepID=UPI003C73E57F